MNTYRFFNLISTHIGTQLNRASSGENFKFKRACVHVYT